MQTNAGKQKEYYQVVIRSGILTYRLERKKVKNIILHINPDGNVWVSANRTVSRQTIEEFIIKKQDFIEKALHRLKEKENIPQNCFTKEDKQKFADTVDRVYGWFQKYKVPYPQVTIRSMKSRWGSCRPATGKITLNSKLAAVPEECLEYVVVHEFAHFLQPNHSKKFWKVVEEFLPDYLKRDVRLKMYNTYQE